MLSAGCFLTDVNNRLAYTGKYLSDLNNAMALAVVGPPSYTDIYVRDTRRRTGS